MTELLGPGGLSRRAWEETITVAAAGTTSNVVDARASTLFALLMPAALTSTTATFVVSNASGGTFVPLYDVTGQPVSIPVAASRGLDLPVELAPWPYWKIVLGSAEAAERSIILVAKS